MLESLELLWDSPRTLCVCHTEWNFLAPAGLLMLSWGIRLICNFHSEVELLLMNGS